MRTRSAAEGRAALTAALRERGGALAEVLSVPSGEPLDEPGPAQIAAAGPRADGREAEYEVLIEMIIEGSRLHYGHPAVVQAGEPDLALLLGDQLYAMGLSRLAALGDLAATAELADVISLAAQAHAAADSGLAEAVWEAGAVAIGWGTSPAHETAKALARDGNVEASAALRRAAVAGRRCDRS